MHIMEETGDSSTLYQVHQVFRFLEMFCNFLVHKEIYIYIPFLEELWKIVSTFNKQYSIFKIWFFFRPSVFINHPDDLETILGSSQHIEKGMIYDAIKPWLGTGLLTSGGNDINITNKGHDATVRHRFNSS
ncbi:PREDICTED: cytochrome P450 4V2-like isoform X2 [Wasmannia auropunctata]|uniref:cytochrome P450 4V2-like isoform X2 n=1 Tax=Wasmannia auropunctata TaxID=64793 RepID=UPI0005EDD835|nr:PREDICTED: cytochrome P450 4V2-like isoform X2 [Wasmannia auropunctata]